MSFAMSLILFSVLYSVYSSATAEPLPESTTQCKISIQVVSFTTLRLSCPSFHKDRRRELCKTSRWCNSVSDSRIPRAVLERLYELLKQGKRLRERTLNWQKRVSERAYSRLPLPLPGLSSHHTLPIAHLSM
ncbi:hypothetical protein Tcan_15214 [Toxocara canis]|uniref:Uncharacterized protein n=1 Tax=Toxocara canis TaxID=6265 RepID=A0A0B2W022_TOXCA|nr:hypothetical protein Tcan_15214 [Toxocara canis]